MKEILPVAKRHLLLANAIVWGAPGIKILLTGIQSYMAIWPSKAIIWLAGIGEMQREYNSLSEQVFQASQERYTKQTLQNLHSGGFAAR